MGVAPALPRTLAASASSRAVRKANTQSLHHGFSMKYSTCTGYVQQPQLSCDRTQHILNMCSLCAPCSQPSRTVLYQLPVSWVHPAGHSPVQSWWLSSCPSSA